MDKRRRLVGRRISQIVKILLLAAMAGAAVYWWRFAPIRVTRTLVPRGEIVAEVMGTGTLEAHIKAAIGPKISGLITKVLVDQGDQVNAGQVLAQLDDSDLSRQVSIGEAGVAAAAAALGRTQAEKARAVAVLEQAKRYRERLATGSDAGAIAQVDLDKAMEGLGVAQAELNRSDAAILEAEKQLATTQKTLEYHRARLTDTIVKAPYDGLIIRRDRDPGDVVAPGSCILAMISPEEIWVSAWVDETEMSRVKPGQPARVVFRSEPSRSYPGEVARLGRETDCETREFVVDVRVRTLPDNWAVGQRAEVYIETARKTDAVVLPARLVIWRDGRPGVFIESAGHAHWRPVSVGLRAREAVEVAGGLQVGDLVLVPTEPTVELTNGRKVSR
ncbi:MAG: efflux RND transporter periplasmic adaptor subunit [Planctomycetes bacterium]|nr:efflux RND transporter periplasmic adaptor subunit [Planctomycetota bacterium]